MIAAEAEFENALKELIRFFLDRGKPGRAVIRSILERKFAELGVSH